MRHSTLYAGVFFVSVAIAGAFQQGLYAYGDVTDIIALVMFLPWVILLRLWLGADAAERGIDIPAGAAILVPLLAIVGLPYYLMRSRTPLVALWQVPIAIVLLLSLSYVYWTGQFLVYSLQVR